MTILIVGQNGSGKSLFAEALAKRVCSGELYYIATMLPCGEEGAARVKKHRAQRSGMGFITVESPYGAADVTERDTVLLEDVSNLVANLMFQRHRGDAAAAALSRLALLRESCENLIAVSITGLDESDGSDAETKQYIAALRQVNDELFNRADVVAELVSGKAIVRKGAVNEYTESSRHCFFNLFRAADAQL